MAVTTLRDIAEATGLTVATVSRALSGKDQIAQGTRRRVREAAERLGYHPDPALSRLAAWRWGTPQASSGSMLAVVTDSEPEMPEYCRRRIQGIRERAQQRGYGVEVFHLRNYGQDPKRIARVLEHRGIRGVLIERVHLPGSFEGFPWEAFACVAVGIGEERLPVPSVTTDLFAAGRMLWQQARERGYQRIGQILLFSGKPDPYLRLLAAAHLEQRSEGGGVVVPILDLQVDGDPMPRFAAWFRKHRPDVILGGEWILPELAKMGVEVPADVAFATHAHPNSGDPRISGAVAGLRRTGHYAVDLCHLQCLRPRQDEEYPHDQILHLIPPRWVEGATFPRR